MGSSQFSAFLAEAYERFSKRYTVNRQTTCFVKKIV